MRIVPKIPDINRRSFLATFGVSAVGLGLAGSAVLPSRQAWAQHMMPSLSPEAAQTVLQMARDIYPHDRIPDRLYQVAVEPYHSAAENDPAFKAIIEEGVHRVNHEASHMGSASYIDIAAEEDRVAILRKMQDDPLFQKLRGDLVVSLYNQTAVWNILGYEGPSADKGGYLTRGFNDLDWL